MNNMNSNRYTHKKTILLKLLTERKLRSTTETETIKRQQYMSNTNKQTQNIIKLQLKWKLCPTVQRKAQIVRGHQNRLSQN